jgi:ATP-dependent RNA helicase RhlE
MYQTSSEGASRPPRRRRPRTRKRQDVAVIGSQTPQPQHPGSARPAAAPLPPLPEPQGVFALLRPELQRALAAEGYRQPTPIQEQSIAPLLEGRDLLGCAQTGTGKTAAFALPLLQQLSQSPRPLRRGEPRALILAPTRELAAQIGESFGTYGRHLRIRHAVIFGGVSQVPQVETLQRGIEILVATPGRLLDLMQQGYIRLQSVEFFVLDEVDRMLDMGFIHDIRRVLVQVPEQRQTQFFSATMAPAIVQLADTLVRNPVRVSIAPEQPTVERIEQQVLFVGRGDKDALLTSLLNGGGVDKAIVFTQMKHVANRVVKKLESAGIESEAIHGNKSQGARTRALDGFRSGRFRVLVATDVAARGLDIDDISHVINYDLPVEAETYVHRIGRTARAGAGGDAISFCTAEDRAYLREIEKLLGKPVPATIGHPFHCEEARHSTLPPPPQGRQAPPPRAGRPRRGQR